MTRLVPAPIPFRDDWKQHLKATGKLVCYLRFDLTQQGRTHEALALIARIVAHPRLARAVFTDPVSGRLPFVLVQKRSACKDEELRQAILGMYPYLGGYGQYHAEIALHLLGDATALDRAWKFLKANGANSVPMT